MHIPMEILSHLTARTDSGSGVRQRAGPSTASGSGFERIFEEALAETEKDSFTKKKIPDAVKDTRPVEEKRDEEKEKAGEVTVTGVMGTQNEVVFILEGNKESAIAPEIRVENTVEPNTDQIVKPDDKEAKKPEASATDTETKQFTLDVKNETDTKEAIETPKQAAVTGTVSAETTAKPAANTENKTENNAKNTNEGAAGEVTARMPVIRTSERQENTENNSKSSEQGNLGPLENENDKTPVKGQKEKTYSDTAEAVKSAAESTEKPFDNVIPLPLSEGIKPEQYRGAMQMRQAAMDAPVKAENLFEEMISRVESMQDENQRSMTIQLKPEFLGKVALEVAVDAAGLHVKISAEDSGVRSMINGQLTALIESLGNKGIEVVEVEVTYTGVGYDTFKDPREGQQQPNHQRRAHREIDSKDGVAYYTVLPELLDYYLDAGVSSVEYSA